MSTKTPRIESKVGKHYEMYNLWWPQTEHPLWREMLMIQRGGEWIKKDGEKAGKGLFYHFKEAIKIAWPHFQQHRWFDLFLENWLAHKYVGVMGPKSSGKTADASICHLLDYYCHPNITTVIVCSDTLENLDDRIWGEIKKLHRIAKNEFHWLPGHVIEGRRRMVTDARQEYDEGRDVRNGMVGIPVKKGEQVTSLSSFVGRKNKRVRICGDELSLLNKSFIDAIASQANLDVKITGMGNPADTMDALGLLCEPAPELGGWDGGIDQTPKTKVWKTRWPNGIAIQFPGSDCPNMDVPPDDPVPYPYLMTRQQMKEDAAIWGQDDWHFTMFNEGRMPKGMGSRRIITRQICLKNNALDEPVWANTTRTQIASLDAAYRGVGGDRCVFIVMEYGEEAAFDDKAEEVETTVKQILTIPKRRIVIHLKEMAVIPIKANDFESPEDQIVMFVKQQCESRNLPARNFFYDSGMRTSLVQAFSRLWSPDVNSIDCGGMPSERQVSENIELTCKEYYSKRITEFWYSVRLIIEAGQFRGMTEDVMREGCMREFMKVAGNKIEVESKEDMKKKTGRSPDLFDALAIGCEGARQRGFSIRRMVNTEYVETDSRWKDELRRKARESEKKYQLNYAA